MDCLDASHFRWSEPTEHFEFAGSVMIHIMVHAEVDHWWIHKGAAEI
jgi:hypothetical protein